MQIEDCFSPFNELPVFCRPPLSVSWKLFINCEVCSPRCRRNEITEIRLFALTSKQISFYPATPFTITFSFPFDGVNVIWIVAIFPLFCCSRQILKLHFNWKTRGKLSSSFTGCFTLTFTNSAEMNLFQTTELQQKMWIE